MSSVFVQMLWAWNSNGKNIHIWSSAKVVTSEVTMVTDYRGHHRTLLPSVKTLI